ncbi:prepilin-type N-terminal cleavage/methylation domain-containing protein [Blautia schinkii]|nr:prepilin-type N-terminal cleavage/methylation domain-containing protein [Blautia schinkii]
MRRKNKGFTLVELVIVISIFAILLGMLAPSLNSILGFRVQRATNSIAAALDKTRVEAMNRLVGEMKLEKRSDGYYISYYLDRGKASRSEGAKEEQPEKIAPAGMVISYTTDTNPEEQKLGVNESVILTYDRATGGFLPLQDVAWEQEDIISTLEAGNDIPLRRTGSYCLEIKIQGGMRTRIIEMDINTGKYTIKAG